MGSVEVTSLKLGYSGFTSADAAVLALVICFCHRGSLHLLYLLLVRGRLAFSGYVR